MTNQTKILKSKGTQIPGLIMLIVSHFDHFLVQNDESPETHSIHVEKNTKSPLVEAQTLPTNFIPLNPIPKEIANDTKHPVFFFDIDNTLYPKSSGVGEWMAQRIRMFFMEHLNLPDEESRILGAKYYKDYGLAIRGLIRHFSINTAVYDEFVDGGLPLEDLLKPSNELSSLLERLNTRGACWAFTNAGYKHGLRVLKLLQIDHLFGGIIYCDYSEPDFPAKPDRLAFIRAMQCAGVDDPGRCIFFDDAIGNIRTARELGWTAIYVDENAKEPTELMSIQTVSLERDLLSIPSGNDAFPTIRRIEDFLQVIKE